VRQLVGEVLFTCSDDKTVIRWGLEVFYLPGSPIA
jgi:hypothetical protein